MLCNRSALCNLNHSLNTGSQHIQDKNALEVVVLRVACCRGWTCLEQREIEARACQ